MACSNTLAVSNRPHAPHLARSRADLLPCRHNPYQSPQLRPFTKEFDTGFGMGGGLPQPRHLHRGASDEQCL